MKDRYRAVLRSSLVYVCPYTLRQPHLSFCSKIPTTPRTRPLRMLSGPPSPRYSVAPMMEVTDRHFRALSRLISRKAVLYTEMVVDRTLIYNEKLRDYALRIPRLPCPPHEQHPVVLQLGGSIPEELEAAARIAAEYGYTEVNLNCGCPSPKVAGKGCFGAALMRSPDVVAEATKRMAAVLPRSTPVTVKCRIGVDSDDSYESLYGFVDTVHREGGVNHFIIHARKAILGGLSPAQNRSIPPLKYDYVHRLLRDFPLVTFTINGGFKTLSAVQEQLDMGVHGVMVGRAVMDKPWHALCDVDDVVFADDGTMSDETVPTRRAVLQDYVAYAESEIEETGCSARAVIKPILNLFHGEPNGKKYRRVIDEGLRDPKLKVGDIVRRACAVLSDSVLDAVPPSVAAKMGDTNLGGICKSRDDESGTAENHGSGTQTQLLAAYERSGPTCTPAARS